MIKAIFMDLDDTLLRSDKTISDYTMQILQKCREKGILIGFCTARGESCTQYFLDMAHPDIWITSGGSLAKYRGEIFYENPLSVEETQLLLDCGRTMPGGPYVMGVDTKKGYYRNDEGKVSPDWGEVFRTDFVDFRQEAMRFLIVSADEQIVADLTQKVENCNYLNFLNSNWYRISKNGATKENAIAKAGEFLGIKPEEMIAFGDDYGDMGMLKFCGIGCAMANHVPGVEKAADVVIGSHNEDGVAHFLEEYVLGRQ